MADTTTHITIHTMDHITFNNTLFTMKYIMTFTTYTTIHITDTMTHIMDITDTIK
jgi:hypothetical protein